MARLFIGITAPATTHEFCCGPLAELDGLRITKRARLHLTLHFLGRLTADQQLRLQQELEKVTRQRFPLTLQGRGSFQPTAKNGVLWIGVRMSCELQDLHQQIASAMVAVGLTPESRPWKPHVTIARFHSDLFSAEAVDGFLHGPTDESVTFAVESFSLFDSAAFKNADEYQILQQFELR